MSWLLHPSFVALSKAKEAGTDPRLARHLERCGECRRRFDALATVSASAPGLRSDAAIDGERAIRVATAVPELLEPPARDALDLRLARALVTRPACVLADEPTGNLDSASGKQVLEILRRLKDEKGKTILLVTHSQEGAAIADRILRMRDGKLL